MYWKYQNQEVYEQGSSRKDFEVHGTASQVQMLQPLPPMPRAQLLLPTLHHHDCHLIALQLQLQQRQRASASMQHRVEALKEILKL
jgi:hypothetical protein